MKQWKKVLLFEILPDFIAGLFSIAPKIFDIVTAPKAELNYYKINGPGLKIDNSIRRIESIVISNDGKKTLQNIVANYAVEKGKIEQSEVQKEVPIQIAYQTSEKSFSLEIENLHPNESVSVSLMVLMNPNDFSAKFSLRSDETTGYEKVNLSKEKKTKSAVSGALSSALSVFIMAIIALKGKLPFFNVKQDALYYIVAKLKIMEPTGNIQLFKSQLTYLHLADIFLSIGLTEEVKKNDCIKGLKCMLHVKQIAKQSLSIIIENLKILESDGFSDDHVAEIRKKAVSVDNLLIFRNVIDEFLLEDSGEWEIIKKT
jgi:hypothetical protein